jgi:Flp pilus assembly protein TadG
LLNRFLLGDITMKKQTGNNAKEQGQSLVELSMSLVVLLILVAGLVDLGRAFFTYIALRDAAQEGASYAAVVNDEALESGDVSTYCSAISNRVIVTTTSFGDGIATSSGPVNLQSLTDGGELSVTTLINGTDCANISPADVCMGGAVSVEVSYDHFPLTMPLIGTILGRQDLALSATVVDTILTPACQ